jgi:hypothetical protein
MTTQSQKAGDFSNNVQARYLHMGDNVYLQAEPSQLYARRGKGLEPQPTYVPISSPDRYTDEAAMGMVYSLFAKDAVATDITHFDKKVPGSNDVERRTTIRFVGIGGERFPIFLRGNHEPPCAVGSSVVVIEARDKNGELLSCGIWEKGIRWNCYPSLPLAKKWKYWRASERGIILALCATLTSLWFLKFHFSLYYEFTQSITSTNVLFFVSALALLASLLPAQMREATIRRRMEEFAYAVPTALSWDEVQSETAPL